MVWVENRLLCPLLPVTPITVALYVLLMWRGEKEEDMECPVELDLDLGSSTPAAQQPSCTQLAQHWPQLTQQASPLNNVEAQATAATQTRKQALTLINVSALPHWGLKATAP